MAITRTANGIMLVVVVKLATSPYNSRELQLRAHLFSKEMDITQSIVPIECCMKSITQ